ncbi:kinase-like domain-containing protein [Plectosphaerella plurivora]|uniref:non-specific serine/threonine protein kinase n=1 Tax=Plectosphaerella plurivora TaxID=936078 RepID=A0A9P9AEY1_9PEZI|nr:kinase-like domain-containing protein [Plectosphaerella plurivora]
MIEGPQGPIISTLPPNYQSREFISWHSSWDRYPVNAWVYDGEEGSENYGPGGHHPVFIGDVFNGRYQVLSKLGYGMFSTVWLVKDLKSGPDDKTPYRAMKCLIAEAYNNPAGKKNIFELEILKHLRDAGPGTTGHEFISHLLDDFEHEGPNGKHVCLIFEPMGETLQTFNTWFEANEKRIPRAVMRRFSIQLILAIMYAHHNGIIHTDIKPDNIFVKFRDFSLIENYLAELEPVEQDREGDYKPLNSKPLRWDYFPEGDVDFSEFDICLGDWGVATWADNHLSDVIQPIRLRAPEVLIRAKDWDQSVDWWNFGCVLMQLSRRVCLFTGDHPLDGDYDFFMHLAQIEDLCGPFPRQLLDRGLPELVEDVFDENCRVKADFHVIDGVNYRTEECFRKLDSDEIMQDYVGQEREELVNFMRMLMKVEPSERPTGVQLLRHPWLDALN